MWNVLKTVLPSSALANRCLQDIPMIDVVKCFPAAYGMADDCLRSKWLLIKDVLISIFGIKLFLGATRHAQQT